MVKRNAFMEPWFMPRLGKSTLHVILPHICESSTFVLMCSIVQRPTHHCTPTMQWAVCPICCIDWTFASWIRPHLFALHPAVFTRRIISQDLHVIFNPERNKGRWPARFHKAFTKCILYKGTVNFRINWSPSELNAQVNPTTCLGDTDCWFQQVTTRVGVVTCWIQQSVSLKQVVGDTCVHVLRLTNWY